MARSKAHPIVLTPDEREALEHLARSRTGVGVAVKLGAGGMEQVIEISLTADEKAALQRSAASVRELVDVMRKAKAESQ